MTTFKQLSLILFLVAGACAPQFTLTQTATSAAVGINDTVINVSSATNINAQNLANQTPYTQLYVQDPGSQGELMQVLGVSGTKISVARGLGGTLQTAHISGAMVLVGQPQWMYNYDPQGACTTASTYVTPWLNTHNGNQWLCSSVTLTWVPGWNSNAGPPATTATVASVAGMLTPSGPLFTISGALAITGFNIPVGFVYGSFCAMPSGAFTTTTANNIAIASTATVGRLMCWIYEPATAKFYPTY